MHEKRKTAGRRNRPGPRIPVAAGWPTSGCPAPAGRSGIVTLARASQRSAWASQGEDAEAVSTARPSTAPAHSPGSTTGWDRQWNIGADWRSTLRGNTGPAASTMRLGVPSKTLGVAPSQDGAAQTFVSLASLAIGHPVARERGPSDMASGAASTWWGAHFSRLLPRLGFRCPVNSGKSST